MPLIVEDGSIKPDANSYCSADDYNLYVQQRGYDPNVFDDQVEAHLIKAMDYLEGLRARFKGSKVSATQPLQWPRRDVWIDDCLWPHTAIPRELYYAQMALALESSLGNELMPNQLPGDKGQIIREKIDVIEVEYANTGGRFKTPAFARADALLAPLLKRNGLRLIRA